MVTFIFVLFFVYFLIQLIDVWENEGENKFDARTVARFMFWNTVYIMLTIFGIVVTNHP